MPEYLAPGVYVEELDIGAKSIEGVSTSTAGFIGETERGACTPQLVTAVEQFARLFGRGGFDVRGNISQSYLPAAVKGFFDNGGSRCFVCRVVGKNAKSASRDFGGGGSGVSESSSPADPEESKKGGKASNPSPQSGKSGTTAVKVTAVGPGAWGNRVSLEIDPSDLFEAGHQIRGKIFNCKVCYWTDNPPREGIPTPDDPKPSLVEYYDNLSIDPKSPDYFKKRVNGRSALVWIDQESDISPASFDGRLFLKGGVDGSDLDEGDYNGDPLTEPGKRTGLLAFEEIDEISILCAPNENDKPELKLTEALRTHCEKMKDRFAILQCSQTADPLEKLRPPVDSKYAAFYYPWIYTINPDDGNKQLIPPGGHIAGVYARSDNERGVHKAPANEVIRGVVGLQFPVKTGEQVILNPRGVNCIRAFEGRGIRVWGARTTSSDPSWKYLNVRRLFLYLEESIEEGTQWVVFEPNDQRLWARVKQTVTDFLIRVWRDGALLGATPDEAFFVRCDRSTMTQDDLDNGRLVALIGIAPVKPAEFVIFRLFQHRGGSDVLE